jgi:hypothetical protein
LYNKPSIKIIKSLNEFKTILRQTSNLPVGSRTVVLGFFDITEDQAHGQDDNTAAEGYPMDPWGQFQASADSLRG